MLNDRALLNPPAPLVPGGGFSFNSFTTNSQLLGYHPPADHFFGGHTLLMAAAASVAPPTFSTNLARQTPQLDVDHSGIFHTNSPVSHRSDSRGSGDRMENSSSTTLPRTTLTRPPSFRQRHCLSRPDITSTLPLNNPEMNRAVLFPVTKDSDTRDRDVHSLLLMRTESNSLLEEDILSPVTSPPVFFLSPENNVDAYSNLFSVTDKSFSPHRAPASSSTESMAPHQAEGAQRETLMQNIISVGAKRCLTELTGFEASDYVDIMFTEEKWFSTDVLVHALCLLNRLCGKFPHWLEAEDDALERSRGFKDILLVRAVDSEDDHLSFATNNTTLDIDSIFEEAAAHTNGLAPRRSFSTAQHPSAQCNPSVSSKDLREGPSLEHTIPKFKTSRSSSSVTSSSISSSIGLYGRSTSSNNGANFSTHRPTWTAHNTPRGLLAVLLLSSKFQGDTIYSKEAVCTAANKARSRQLQRRCQPSTWRNDSLAQENAASTTSSLLVYPKLMPSRLGQCETRLWKALDCGVWVKLPEFQRCYDYVVAAGKHIC